MVREKRRERREHRIVKKKNSERKRGLVGPVNMEPALGNQRD